MKISGARGIHYDSGPNMIPLVDIVMVILIFLMLTGTFAGAEHYLTSNLAFRKSGVGVTNQSAVIPDQELLQIRVAEAANRDGFVAVAGQYQATNKQSLAAALTKLRDGYRASNTNLDNVQVVIAPARTVKYKHVIQVFEAAQLADFPKIGFAPPQ
jgi:biopolymer transport protein ExbD